MPAEMLFRPENRLLTFSTNDFSNYGGQPDTHVLIRTIPSEGGFIHPPTTPAGSPATTPGVDDVAPVASPDPAAITAPASAETAFAQPQQPEPPHVAADAAPLVATPIGGSTQPDLSANSQQPGQALHPEAPQTAGIEQGGAVPHSPIDAAFAVSAVSSATQPLGGTVDATTAFALETVGDATASVSDAIDGAIQNVASAIGSGIAPITTPAADAVGGVAHDVVGDAASAPAAVDYAVDGAVTTAAPVADLGGLSGSDPAAGVATLVNLVSADNLFDLREAGSTSDAHEAPSSSIDNIIGEAAEVSPLLGDAAHHDDAGTSATDTHIDHVLGGI